MVRRMLLVAVLVGAACSNESDTAVEPVDTAAVVVSEPEAETTQGATTAPPTTEPAARYSATIARGEFGVPHISAADLGSVAFGQGYAMAQDRGCTMLEAIIAARGEMARWFGPGPDDAYLEGDLARRHVGLYDSADARFADISPEASEVVDGFVAGVNAQLAAEGPNGWCAGESWVAPISRTDLLARMADLSGLASLQPLLGPVARATPPAEDAAAASTPIDTVAPIAADTTVASNGWAIGTDLAAEANGLLMANPHFPWEGDLRLWESHLTVPGRLDVYGVTLTGVPMVLIGFNQHVAWTHTVSAGHRFTAYQLDLAAGDPTAYVVDGETIPMESHEVAVEVLGDDGSTETVSRTMWSSRYGPMIEIPVPWDTTTAFSFRDGNAATAGLLDQFLGMNLATSLEELQQVHAEVTGIPWVNTMAVSADGRAWYTDASTAPNLSDDAVAAYREAVEAGGLARLFSDQGFVLLPGNSTRFDWVDEPGAPAPGLMPFSKMPALERSDAIFNANDSHWIANPDAPLEGFSPMTGRERTPLTPRTRMNALMLFGPGAGGDDGQFTLAEVQASIFSDRSLMAEQLRPGLVEACRATPTAQIDGAAVDLAAACDALDGWDGRFSLDARGAVVFREWLSQFEFATRYDAGPLFATAFDADDPVNTPSGPSSDTGLWIDALGRAVLRLQGAGVAVDSPLGEIQHDGRVGQSTPLHGGFGDAEGIANDIGCCSGYGGTGPSSTFDFLDGSRLSTDGRYPVTFGGSFIMTLAYTDGGVSAAAVLTYGQPDDPADPEYSRQTELYSAGQFRPIRFTPAEIAADPELQTITVSGN